MVDSVKPCGCPYGELGLQSFRADHHMREIQSGGLLWRYHSCGTGRKSLLILPGGERVAELGFPFVAALEGEYRLIYPSYPDNAGLAGIITGLIAIMDAECVERFSVFGASFGGSVAQTLVRAHPERVSGLILAGTGVPDRKLVPITRRINTVIRLLPDPWLKALLARLMSAVVPGKAPGSAFWKGFIRETVRSGVSKAGVLSLLAATIDYRLQQFSPTDLVSWGRPVVIVESERDEVVQPKMRAALTAMYPGASIVTLRGAGHIPWLTHWDEYIGAIRGLLARAAE